MVQSWYTYMYTRIMPKTSKGGRPKGSKDGVWKPPLRTRNTALKQVAARANDGDANAQCLLLAMEIVRDARAVTVSQDLSP